MRNFAYLLSLLAVVAAQSDGELFELNIIHYNDFHAHFEEVSATGSVCSPGEQCIGGIARLSTAINEALEAEPDSLLLNGGDTFQGTIWYNFLRWNVTEHFMNLLPHHDAHVLGNHEFDHGVEGLVPYLEKLDAIMLGANVNTTYEPDLTPHLHNHVVVTRRGRRIGIIGVLLRVFSAPIGQVIMEDEVEAINREAAILTEQGVDIIVVLSHVGYDNELRIAERVSSTVDIIVGAHSHTLLYNGETPSGDTALGEYPTVVTQANGHRIPVVQASCYTRYLGTIKLFIDDEGTVQRWEGQPVYLGTSIVQDPVMLEALEPWREEVDAVGKEVLGTTLARLSRGCYSAECILGSWACDGFLEEIDAKMSQLTLEKFDCDGDYTSVGIRWERWKRALSIYLDAAGIDKSEKKKASLLHFGGLELQEIFYNIPETSTTDDEDVFQAAIDKLDSYFAPKQSKVYERHLFQLISQESNEKFEKFLVRLRQQADKCKFNDKEDQIIDQITEKCSSKELRKKILQTGDSITLSTIITEANALEAVNRQLDDFASGTSRNVDINKVDQKANGTNRENFKRRIDNSGCGRCGNKSHGSQDIKCPARNKDCLKCGYRGHFRQFCRSKSHLKRKNDTYSYKTESKRFKSQNRNDETKNKSKTSDDLNYVFKIDEDSELECEVGGIKVNMLVDSGCKCNLITSKTWEILKTKNVKLENNIKNPSKTFYGYGSNQPLKVLESFDASVKIAHRSETATFYVIEDGTRNLLGKQTSMSMGILRIGLETNQLETEESFPKFKNIQVHISIDEKIQPVSQPLRRIPIPLEERVNKKIEELIERDIIEVVNGSSKWVSPIVPVLKDNGEIRLCVDMRRANTAILRENHPLPTFFFSKLDIKDAFHQLELHPDSRHITTFITGKGLYRYKRLMFGISCAPEIFQKTLERILIGCEGTINFIDDILVYGEDIQAHDRRLEKVKATLEENNVVLRKDKCLYRKTDIQFLGHEFSGEGVKPLQKYVSSIQGFRAPINIGELQSFLGLINFVGKWIPDLATKTEPLKELLRTKQGKGSEINKHWGTKQETAFDELKLELSNIPTLGYYDVNDKTVVIADASPVALGGVLVQMDQKGPRIIAYGHKTLTDCERRYCQTEKEALALVWAVERFHIFLYGKQFELVTDHKPLEVIFGPKSKPCARIERWILRLQTYEFKVVYKPGKENIADSLSRLCCLEKTNVNTVEEDIHQIVELAKPTAVSLEEIIKYSDEDQEIVKVKEGIYNNSWDDNVKNYSIIKDELCFYEGLLLRGTRIVIPTQLRKRVLAAAHEGHPGIVLMKARLRTKVWWPRYDKDAETLVKTCKGCTLVSAPNPPNPLKRRELPNEPWIDIAIDLMGPFPNGDFILVVVDYFSRYKEVVITRKISSSDIIKNLKQIFSRFGNPSTITADNGRQFCSQEFKQFCKDRNIFLFSTVPYWPQQNGEVERQNRDILKRLKISQTEKGDWKEALEEYLAMYNSTPHSVTGKPPAELFFRRQFRDKIPMISDLTRHLEDSDVRDRDKQKKQLGKEYADEKRNAKECDLIPGDKVYLKNLNRENKLSLNYNPVPHTVEKNTGGDIEVRNDSTGQISRRNVVHLKRVEGHWKVINDKEGEVEHESDSGMKENKEDKL